MENYKLLSDEELFRRLTQTAIDLRASWLLEILREMVIRNSLKVSELEEALKSERNS